MGTLRGIIFRYNLIVAESPWVISTITMHAIPLVKTTVVCAASMVFNRLQHTKLLSNLIQINIPTLSYRK